jgi:surface antigen
MYKSAIAGLFLCVFVIGIASSSTVNAEALTIAKITETQQPLTEVLQGSVNSDKAVKAGKATKPRVVSHTVQSGESLSKIATKHRTTWKRLFDKNTNVANPDVITVGQTIVVPSADEKLPNRPLPKPAATTIMSRNSQPRATTSAASNYTMSRGSSTGNLYTPGYCTWYVKNMRPDLPNNLGNADTWVARAAAQGLPTGSTPRVGAAGQRGMHVVYVESVNAGGTVTISEMNHQGLYIRTVRTLPASYFTYIY